MDGAVFFRATQGPAMLNNNRRNGRKYNGNSHGLSCAPFADFALLLSPAGAPVSGVALFRSLAVFDEVATSPGSTSGSSVRRMSSLSPSSRSVESISSSLSPPLCNSENTSRGRVNLPSSRTRKAHADNMLCAIICVEWHRRVSDRKMSRCCPTMACCRATSTVVSAPAQRAATSTRFATTISIGGGSFKHPNFRHKLHGQVLNTDGSNNNACVHTTEACLNNVQVPSNEATHVLAATPVVWRASASGRTKW
mmetsp:Transcript_23124/g.67039  ORF Transcript_23124/g.67039 Transcript_23124/m.67039 type:complete len:252 (-) Transcript_23124:936-1691(-)